MAPLAASNDAVAAYLRRERGRAALVVVHLGTAPLSGVTLSSTPGALPAGRYTPRSLLGDAAAAPLRVGADGRIRGYRPARALAAMPGYVFELSGG